MAIQDGSLHLHVLPAAQRRLWDELHELPSAFVLYGGTSIALRLGHRQSVDYVFFVFSDIAPTALRNELRFLAGAETLQLAPNTLTVLVDRGGPVTVSFFGLPWLQQMRAPELVTGNGLMLASLLDLAATKVEVVQARAETKDYLDIDALLTQTDLDLTTMLAAAAVVFGPSFNAQISLKALSYFGDLPDLPPATQTRLAAAARAVDLDHLPTLRPWSGSQGRPQ